MAWIVISLAVGVAIVLFLSIVIVMSSRHQTFSENIEKTINWSAFDDEELQSYLPEQKISAIKRYRELTEVGLKEAKEAVEYVMANPDSKKGKRGLITGTGGEGIRDLLVEGRIEEAVDVYAAFMGVDEFTARDAIENMQRELEAESNLSDDLSGVYDLVAQGKKIEAIKQYRELTGSGLADAKRAVEEME